MLVHYNIDTLLVLNISTDVVCAFDPEMMFTSSTTITDVRVDRRKHGYSLWVFNVRGDSSLILVFMFACLNLLKMMSPVMMTQDYYVAAVFFTAAYSVMF